MMISTWPGSPFSTRLSSAAARRKLAHREPVPVGGGQRQVSLLNLDQHTGEDWSRLVRGGRHLGLLDGLDQLIERHLQPVALVRSRTWRKLLGLDALDVGVEACTAQ